MRSAAAAHQPLLHGSIVGERAVSVEMILGDVDQDADRGIERRRQIDLIGRDLDHVHAARLRRRERENSGADIAADLGLVAGRTQQVRGERGGGRLAVGAGDGDERRARRMRTPLAAEQLDVADHLDRRRARQPHRPVRRRVGERNAGRQHQRRDPRPVDMPQIGGRNPGRRRLGHAVGIVVPADDIGTAGQQRARARQPGVAEAEDGDLAAGEGGDRDHHRSFSVESPASASTTEMIQKRITICGSVQPFCSK
jgi:hypothetical protein